MAIARLAPAALPLPRRAQTGCHAAASAHAGRTPRPAGAALACRMRAPTRGARLATSRRRSAAIITFSTPADAEPDLSSDTPEGDGDVLSIETPVSSAEAEVVAAPLRKEPGQWALTQPAPAQQRGTFDWAACWYPLLAVANADAGRPHHAQLLGRDLVLWRGADGKWGCLEDKCPHRLAPLSQGRVEADGTLMCAYHGWRFTGCGACTAIPQAPEATAAKMCGSARARAAAFPTLEAQGLLWVWATPGDDARAAATPARLIPELEDAALLASGRVDAWPGWYARDLSYGVEVALEGLVDVAHVPVTHHGTLANRYTDAKPLGMKLLEPLSDAGGFKASTDWMPRGVGGALTIEFRPPMVTRVVTEFPDGSLQILVFMFVPTSPGTCRQFRTALLVRSARGARLPMVSEFLLWPLPLHTRHAIISVTLAQDIVLLHAQDRIVRAARQRAGAAATWADTTFTPTQSDLAVISLRKWFERNGRDGEVPWPKGVDATRAPVLRDGSELLDVWHSHTKDCAQCRAAAAGVAAARNALAAGCAAAATYLISHAAAGRFSPTAAALVLVFAAAAYAAEKYRRLFYEYHFNHQDNN